VSRLGCTAEPLLVCNSKTVVWLCVCETKCVCVKTGGAVCATAPSAAVPADNAIKDEEPRKIFNVLVLFFFT